jgi:hypothetical protein
MKVKNDLIYVRKLEIQPIVIFLLITIIYCRRNRNVSKVCIGVIITVQRFDYVIFPAITFTNKKKARAFRR